jgi:hypothetical protein
VATSLEEAGDRLFALLWLPQASATRPLSRRPLGGLPYAETATMLFCALLTSPQITIGKLNAWQTFGLNFAS